MTYNIVDFPNLAQRDELEFDKTGMSTLTRAIEEAHALWEATMAALPDPSALRARLTQFEGMVKRLRIGRPEAVNDEVLLRFGPNIPLADAASLLRSIIGYDHRLRAPARP